MSRHKIVHYILLQSSSCSLYPAEESEMMFLLSIFDTNSWLESILFFSQGLF